MPDPNLPRAEAEAAAGRLWRAKEILAGSMGARGYSPERFAAYGRILARMQDTREAGKYLFLSGQAEPGEGPVVEVFLGSVRGRPPEWIYSQFPGAARRHAFADFPERVRAGLGQLGFPPGFRWKGKPLTPVPPGTTQTIGAAAIGISIVLLIVIGLIHGCHVVGGWIFGP